MSIIVPREFPHLGPPEPPRPGERPRKGATDWLDPDHRAFIADWLGHVDAGRIGGNAPVNEEARAIVLANERLLLGRCRSCPE
jgi:hypothetical protein